MRDIEDVPESSTTGVIISLYKGKKKDRLDRNNYRGITLTNILGNVFERLMLDGEI